MELHEKVQDDVIVFKVAGEIMGGEETKAFQARIYDLIQNETVDVVMDMEQVKWMNSSGLGMLMGGLTTLRSSGGDLRLAGVSERVRRPMEITKLDQVIQIYDSVNQAIQSFKAGG